MGSVYHSHAPFLATQKVENRRLGLTAPSNVLNGEPLPTTTCRTQPIGCWVNRPAAAR